MSSTVLRARPLLQPALTFRRLRLSGAALIMALALGLVMPVPSAGATSPEPRQRGADIDGEAAGDYSGSSSLPVVTRREGGGRADRITECVHLIRIVALRDSAGTGRVRADPSEDGAGVAILWRAAHDPMFARVPIDASGPVPMWPVLLLVPAGVRTRPTTARQRSPAIDHPLAITRTRGGAARDLARGSRSSAGEQGSMLRSRPRDRGRRRDRGAAPR